MPDKRTTKDRQLDTTLAGLLSLSRGDPDLTAGVIGLQQIIAKRRAAKSVPATAVTTPPVKRDRAHFRPDGIHLSDVGVAFIRRLFDDGVSISEAAKALGISKAGAQQQRNAWLLKT